MFEGLEKALGDLDNKRAGWVTRRDAALALGKFARYALHSLKAHQDDGDVDIRKAVQDALSKLEQPPDAVLDSAPGAGLKPANTLKELLHAVERPNVRTIQPYEDGYLVDVRIDTERSQTVYVKPQDKHEDARQIRVFTYCGSADTKTSLWALQANVKLADCAFAVFREGDVNRLVLIRNLPWETATPELLKAVVKQVAYYGDWFEKKTTGKDEF